MDEPKAMIIFCDNQGAIAPAKNPHFHSQMKHIEIQHNFMCEKVRWSNSTWVHQHGELGGQQFDTTTWQGKIQEVQESLRIGACLEGHDWAGFSPIMLVGFLLPLNAMIWLVFQTVFPASHYTVIFPRLEGFWYNGTSVYTEFFYGKWC